MKYIKKFNELNEGMELPSVPKVVQDAINLKKDEMIRLKKSGTEEEIVDFYTKEKRKHDIRTERSPMEIPMPEHLWYFKILLQHKFNRVIEDGMDVDEYIKNRNKKGWIDRVGDFFKGGSTSDTGPM